MTSETFQKFNFNQNNIPFTVPSEKELETSVLFIVALFLLTVYVDCELGIVTTVDCMTNLSCT